MIMLVANENTLARPPHAILLVVFLKSFQSRKYRWILFGLILLSTERVIAERKQANGFRLVRREELWENRPVVV